MSTPLKLTLYGGALIATFAVAYVLGAVIIPESFVQGWIEGSHGH